MGCIILATIAILLTAGFDWNRDILVWVLFALLILK